MGDHHRTDAASSVTTRVQLTSRSLVSRRTTSSLGRYTTDMKRHEWQIFVDGPSELLGELAALFSAGDPRFERSTGRWALRSDRLDEIDEIDTVESEAQLLLSRCTALAHVYLTRTGDVTVQQVHCEYDRKHGQGGFLYASIRVISPAEATRIETDAEELKRGLASKIIRAAEHDDRVAEVLAYVGHADMEWPAIYSALEAIARDLKTVVPGKGAEWSVLADAGWVARSVIEAIKQTANSYRHAKGYPLPKNPPNLTEARITTNNIVRAWLRTK